MAQSDSSPQTVGHLAKEYYVDTGDDVHRQ